MGQPFLKLYHQYYAHMERRQESRTEKKLQPEFQSLQRNTALFCTLVRPCFGPSSLVCGDSFFESVGKTEELHRCWPKFIQVVSTAHRKFPLSHTSQMPMSCRFQHRKMVSKDSNCKVRMEEIVWVDKERRYFMTSVLNTLSVQPPSRVKWLQENGVAQPVELTTIQSNSVQLY